ncbi:MAG: hypothetical protein OXJ56_10045 [Rhodospirillaceae bacterium]|nr:hypothetical protein [Rhodospirillaceae bacterium]
MLRARSRLAVTGRERGRYLVVPALRVAACAASRQAQRRAMLAADYSDLRAGMGYVCGLGIGW